MLETLECGTPACSAVLLVAGFAFPELFPMRACVVACCEYHGSVPSPGFPAPGRRRRQIFHQRVGKSLGSSLLTPLSVRGCCRNTELFLFPLPLCCGGMCCTSSLRDTLDNTTNTNTWSKAFPGTQTFLDPNCSCCSSCHPGDFGALLAGFASSFPFSCCRAFPNGTWSDFQHSLYFNWSSCCSARCKFASFSPFVSRTKNCEHLSLILVGVN